MAKTNRRPSDKFERKQRLAQRPQRQFNDDFDDTQWLRSVDVNTDDELEDVEASEGAY